MQIDIDPYVKPKLSENGDFAVNIRYEDGDLTMMFLAYEELSKLENFHLVKEYVDNLILESKKKP